MSDAQRRAIRSLFQTGSGSVILGFSNVMGWITLTPEQMAAALAVWALVSTFIQNWLEDNTNTPALLKAPTSPGNNPEPDPGAGRRMEQPDTPPIDTTRRPPRGNGPGPY